MNERASSRGAAGMGPGELLLLAQRVERNGRPALEDSGVRERIADFYVRASGLKYTSYRTLTALSRGETPGPESSITKLVSAPMRQQMGDFGIELQGQAGSLMDAEFGCQDTYLSAPGSRIAAGTDEILRNIIAERVLKLPGEPRVDKDVPFKDIPSGNS